MPRALTFIVFLITALALALMGNSCQTKCPRHFGDIKVFPGAEGYGTDTVAGRCGTIIKVTNLNDSGAGSLRAALEATYARTVVFEVGGVIQLESDLHITSPYITVAGQSAPWPGIMVRDFGLRISSHDVLLQHLAIRVGDENKAGVPQKTLDTLDAIQVLSGSYNVVIDHISTSWAIDETIQVWGEGIHDVTVSNSIVSEALQASLHSKGTHSMGIIVGYGARNIAMVGNLFAHNKGRNPYAREDTTTLILNNLMYNADGYFVHLGEDNTIHGDELPLQSSIIGNTGIIGPDQTGKEMVKVLADCPVGSKLYHADNHNDGFRIVRSDAPWGDPTVSTSPMSLDGYNIRSGATAMRFVLANAGSRPTERDTVDARIVREVKTKSGKRINSQAEVGGWPDYPPRKRAFDTGPDPCGDDDGDGYTNIEEQLHKMAAMLERID